MESPETATVPEVDEAGGEAPAALGRFALERRLGAGGMGVVYQARDPMLGRAVALKVLRAGGGVVDQARLLREAQSLARLAHPNVVTIFEVGVADEDVYVAMELVEGGTLGAWLDAPHGWRAIVDTFVAVGRGLAAVHALELVHRDVKPSNVLIDTTGAPKLGDFGLVCRAGETSAEPMGTPSYMAPEQRRCAPADPRADQYAFAVALRDALGDHGPSRLRAILARAASVDPDARYPAMAPLLADLERARRGPARWWIAGGAVAAIGGAVALTWTLGRSQPAAVDRCPAPVSTVWTEARAAEVRARVTALGAPEAQAAAVARMVEPYVADWASMHVAACTANRIQARESDTLHDQRVRCLDRRAAELDASLRPITAAADRDALDGALHGLQALSPIAECGDPEALERADVLPLDPKARAAAEALIARAEALEVETRAGRLEGAAQRLAALVADARAVGHPGVLAVALRLQAAYFSAVDDASAALPVLRELAQVAAVAHNDHFEALAWIDLITLVGYDQSEPDEGLAMVPAASAAVHRAGDPIELRAALLLAQAQVLDSGPRKAEAFPMLAEARQLLEAERPRLDGPLVDVVLETASAHYLAGDLEAAIPQYRDAVAMTREVFGPDTVDEAMALYNLGTAQQRHGDTDDAVVSLRAAVQIVETRVGDSPLLADDLSRLALVLGDQGHWDEALAAHDRALAIARPHLEPGDPLLTRLLTGRASALTNTGRTDEALAAYEELIGGTPAADPSLAFARYNRGELLSQLDRCADALTDYRAALAAFEAERGPIAATLIYPLVGEGRCLVVIGKPAKAIAPLTRATELDSEGGDARRAALADEWLGRALVESGRDVARGTALARDARAALAVIAEDPEIATELADLDHWFEALRKHLTR